MNILSTKRPTGVQHFNISIYNKCIKNQLDERKKKTNNELSYLPNMSVFTVPLSCL